MITILDAKLLDGLVWMRENFIRNGWNNDGSHNYKLFLPIQRAIDGNCDKADIEMLVEWTDPRSEIYAGMIPPSNIDNSGGWGAARKMNEIHNFLKRYL